MAKQESIIVKMVSCPLCKGSAKFYCQIIHNGDWEIYRCMDCGCQFVYPVPDDKSLNEMYQKFYAEDAEQVKRLRNPNYGMLSFPRQARIIEKFSGKKEGKILDYGCGGGHFLDRMSLDWGKTGVEISDRAREIAQAKSIYTVNSLDRLPGGFDVITMFAVIEHLPNPREILIRLDRQLKNGGLFVIMTGDVSSFKAWWQGKKWHLYTPPGHLFFFTRKSIDKMMWMLGYRKIKGMYTDGGMTQIKFMPLNIIIRILIEIYHRIPLINQIPIFDCYYGYYVKE